MAVLVKPQFEAGREQVSKGGVVRDPAVHREVLRRIAIDAAPAAGLSARGLEPSPLLGPAGNREYLRWITDTTEEETAPLVDTDVIGRAVEKAFSLPRVS